MQWQKLLRSQHQLYIVLLDNLSMFFKSFNQIIYCKACFLVLRLLRLDLRLLPPVVAGVAGGSNGVAGITNCWVAL